MSDGEDNVEGDEMDLWSVKQDIYSERWIGGVGEGDVVGEFDMVRRGGESVYDSVYERECECGNEEKRFRQHINSAGNSILLCKEE